jgi:hypothetical protein
LYRAAKRLPFFWFLAASLSGGNDTGISVTLYPSLYKTVVTLSYCLTALCFWLVSSLFSLSLQSGGFCLVSGVSLLLQCCVGHLLLRHTSFAWSSVRYCVGRSCRSPKPWACLYWLSRTV